MCLRSWLCSWLCKPKPPDDMPRPQNLAPLDLSEMIGILGAEFPGVNIYIKDHEYMTTTLDVRSLISFEKNP